MKKLKIAYFGTPYFSAQFLEKLLTDASIKHLIEASLVLTQPDKPTGRKLVMTKSPVKTVAEKFGIKVFDNQIVNSQFVIEELKKTELAFLFAYGQIIPKNILDIPKLGFWNTHPSLLPKYRGALPIAMPLILGDHVTGVSLIKLDEKVDHGPIIAQEKLAIKPGEKRPDLEVRLTNLAFEIFQKKLSQLSDNRVSKIKTEEQDHSKATFTYQIGKDAGFIPLTILISAINNEPLSADSIPKIIKDYHKRNNVAIKQWDKESVYNLFRGLYPWPGIWTLINLKGQQKRIKIIDLEYLKGKLIIKKVQLEGKKEVDFKTFNSAYQIF